MKRLLLTVLALGTAFLIRPNTALAGDAATLIFESGQVVMIEDGYRQIVDSMKGLTGQPDQHKIVELNIGGGSFLLNVSQVVVVCRDDCKSLLIRHQLDPARSKNQGSEGPPRR